MPDVIAQAHELITKDDAQYALDFIKRVCTEVGPGTPGSHQERERAAAVKKELEAHLGVGTVVAEEFAVSPNAFVGSFLLSGTFIILAALLSISAGRLPEVSSWAIVIPALTLSVIPLLLFVVGFVFGNQLIDSLFSAKQSVNIVGSLRRWGTASVKRLLILSAHHDSAWENNWLRLPGYGFFIAAATYLAGMVAMLALAVIQLVGLVAGSVGLVRLGALGLILLAYPVLPSAFLSLLYNTSARKNGGSVPGVADNLSGCAAVVTMSRLLARSPQYIPPGTEIRFVTFGSEEAGLRGSRQYVQRHGAELRRLDTRLLNLEIIAHREVGVLTLELNGTVKNSPEMVKSVVVAAERARVPYRVKPAFLGVASDASSFSRAGIKATTLLCFKMPQQLLGFYHQKRDGPEILSIEPLSNVLKTSFEWIRSGGD